MLQLLFVFLSYLGITLVDRLFVAAIASAAFLSFESKIFCKAFLPITVFLSVLLLINPAPEFGWIVFIGLLLGARVTALLADGNRYVQKLILHEDRVEVLYLTDFLKQRAFYMGFSDIRSIKIDNVIKSTDFPCMMQLVPKTGRVIKLSIIDREQLMILEKEIARLIQRLEFTENR